MTVVIPGGAPDWTERGAVISDVLYSALNQPWAVNFTATEIFDVSAWSTVVMIGWTNMVGSGMRIGIEFFADAALAVPLSSTFAIANEGNQAVLQLPVVGRFLRVTAFTGNRSPAGILFNAYVVATTAPLASVTQFLPQPIVSWASVNVNAGATVIVQPGIWAPGRYWINGITDAAVYSVNVVNYDVFGAIVSYAISLTQASGIQGVPYTFILQRYCPRLEVTNGDGVNRKFSISWLAGD